MRTIGYLIAAAVAAVSALLAVPASAATAAKITPIPNFTYSGWSVHPQFGQAWEAAAHWTVPAVTCDTTPLSRPWVQSRAAVWVGTWGKPSDANAWLPQVGTVSQCDNGGKTYYKAVYQMERNGGPPPTTLPMTIKPGDQIYAYILFDGYSSGEIRFQYWIQDLSQKTQKSGLIYTAKGVSTTAAMWEGGVIVETQPDGSIGILPDGGLAKFKPITFTTAEVNGTAIQNFPGICTNVNGPCSVYRWDLDTPNNVKKPLATVGPRGTSGKFIVTWDNYR
jgi:hypothetical protein